MKIDTELHEAFEQIDVPRPAPDFFDQLEQQLINVEQEAPVKVRHIRWNQVAARSLIGAAAAAIVITAFVYNGDESRQPNNQIALPTTTGTITPQTTVIHPVLASQVIAKANSTLANTKSLIANVTYHQYPYALDPGYTAVGTLKLRNDGRFLIDYLQGIGESHGPEIDSYDPTSGVAETCWLSDKQWACSSTKGITPTDPQAQLPMELGSLSAVLRNAVADDSKAVDETNYDGRKAWKISASITNGAFYADAASVVVDQETGMVLDVVLTTKGKPFSETKLSNIAVNTELSDADLTLTKPKGAQVNTPDDMKAKPTTLDAVELQAGYAPIAPQLDDDWKLQQVYFTKTDGGNNANPESKNIVALTYRRGLESVTFTTRSKGTGKWISDPLYADGDAYFGKKSVPLTQGAFAGTTVTVETQLSSQHLWGVGSNLVLAIAGDLTADEMVDAANSLTARK